MEHSKATDAFQALGHAHRLQIFRLLVREGDAGLAAGAIAASLDVPPSSLSFHLDRLERAGLISARRRGRQIIYTLNQQGTRNLLAYLTEDCCHGKPALCGDLLGHGESDTAITAPCNVLFLCTGNSARSIIAECILNREGAGEFRAYSAGSLAKGAVHPAALKLLRAKGHDVSTLRSKGWEEFADGSGPEMELIITVCDNAASETCPVWPGHPMTVHWGVPDPAVVHGSEHAIEAAFERTYRAMQTRISELIALPVRSLDQQSLRQRLRDIGTGRTREPVAPPEPASN